MTQAAARGSGAQRHDGATSEAVPVVPAGGAKAFFPYAFDGLELASWVHLNGLVALRLAFFESAAGDNLGGIKDQRRGLFEPRAKMLGRPEANAQDQTHGLQTCLANT
jgi:hypothetical protein